MAWYALYKWFSPWRKKPYTNYILWYSAKLYEEWFKLLPKEEQTKLLERKKRERKLSVRRLMMIRSISDIIAGQK